MSEEKKSEQKTKKTENDQGDPAGLNQLGGESASAVQLILIFAVGVVVLLNYFELRGMRASVLESVDENRNSINQLFVDVREARGQMHDTAQQIDEFEERISEGLGKILR